MIEFSIFWLVEIIRATLVLAIAVLVAKSLLRFTQAKPQTRVVTWMLVLVPCWLMFSFALEIPWLENSEESGITSTVVWGLADQTSNSAPASAVEFATAKPAASKLSSSVWIANLLLVVWVAGMIFLVLKYFKSYSRVRCSLRRIKNQSRSNPPIPASWLDEFEKAKRETGLRRNVEFLVSDDLGPLLCWFEGQNFVVVPKTFWELSTPQQRSAIVLHELAHAKRFDVWWMLIARILILPQWFNPLAWYALRQFSESVEMACDDEVLKHSKFGRIEYAKSLVALVEFKQSDVSFGLRAIGPPVQQRIQRIVHPNGVEMKFAKMIAIGSLVLVSSFGLVRPELVAQNSNSKADSELNIGASQPLVTATSKAVKPDEEVKPKVMSYDVSDLILYSQHLPQKPLQGGLQMQQLGGITLHDFLPIVDLIQSTIDSESWGEDGKSISPYPQNLTLVICQTPAIHEQIRDLLAKLRGIDQFTIKLESFIVLSSKTSRLLPTELGKIGKPIDSKVVQTIRDAATSDAIELISIPETNPINGQSVVYQGLNKDLWSVEGLSATALMNKSRTSINIKLSGMTSWPFSASRNNLVNKMVDGHVVELQRGTIIESIQGGIESEDEGRQRGERHRNRVEKSIGVATVEDGKYLALDISSMLKNDRQDRRAILIVNAKIKDNQKQEDN